MGTFANDINGINGGYDFDEENYQFTEELKPKPFGYCNKCKITQVKIIKGNKWICEECKTIMCDYVA